MLTRLNCDIVDMGVVPRRARGARARVRHRRRERRRRHHVGRRLGGRSRLRQAAARQAGRSAVLEDRDEAGPAARLRQDRQRALLRPAGQSGRGDGDVLRSSSAMRCWCCRAARRRADADVQGDARRRRSSKAPGRTEFQRGILAPDGAGGWTVRTTGDQGSGILSSMSQANCFIVLPTPTGQRRRRRDGRRAAARRLDLTRVARYSISRRGLHADAPPHRWSVPSKLCFVVARPHRPRQEATDEHGRGRPGRFPSLNCAFARSRRRS